MGIGRLALGMALALASVPATAQTIPLQTAKDAAAQVGRYFSQSRACNWANPIAGNAHGSLYGYVYGTVLAEQGKAVADTVVMGSPPAKPCGSAEDKAEQNAAVQATFEWLTRLASAQVNNGQADWRKDMLDLPTGAASAEAYRQQLEAQLKGAMGEAVLQQYYARIGQETVNDFGLACNSRKIMGKTTRACPPVPESAAPLVPVAIARIKALEDLAFKLDRDHRNAAMGAHGTAYRAVDRTDTAMDPFAPCRAGELVVYPGAPDTQKSGARAEMTLRRFQQPGAAGRVVLEQAGGGVGYVVVDASKAPDVAELRPTLYAIEFQMCGN